MFGPLLVNIFLFCYSLCVIFLVTRVFSVSIGFYCCSIDILQSDIIKNYTQFLNSRKPRTKHGISLPWRKRKNYCQKYNLVQWEEFIEELCVGSDSGFPVSCKPASAKHNNVDKDKHIVVFRDVIKGLEVG